MPVRLAAKAALKEGIVRAASLLPRRTGGMRCLMYHSVVTTEATDELQMSVPASLFGHQLAHLRDRGYRVEDAAASVARLRGGVEPLDGSVVLTFDDGYEDNHRVALPLLRQFGYRATVFLVADGLAGRIPPQQGRSYLDISGAREMLQSGLVTFGCHSATHRNLRGLSPQELDRETAGARQQLEDALGAPVTLFAYPFGSYDAFDAHVRAAVERAGFDGAFTSIVGPNTSGRDPFLLRRSRISWAERVPSFSRLLTGGYDWYAAVQWLHARRALAAAPVGYTN